MKSKEELAALKEEVEALSRKLAELTEEELEQVTGGLLGNLRGEWLCPNCGHSCGSFMSPVRPRNGRVTCPSCRNHVEPVWKENQ